MASFYTGVDKSIYEGGDHFLSMDKFRLNPYEQKNLSYESSQPQSYGITNTNAFTNSGGAFNASGNAFGYGSAIKPGDPSVLTSGPYAGQSGYYGSGNYQGGLPGDIAQQGPGRHFEYEFTGTHPVSGKTMNYATGMPATGEFYRDYSLTPKKEVPGWARMAAGFIPFGNTALNFIENRMNPEGPLTADGVNQGRYAMAGLSDIDKQAYNELAGSGMLFDGSSGIKTLTGKNFGAKGYFEGQAELAKEFGFDTMSDEDIQKDLAASELNKNKQFEYKQKLEAYKMMNFKKQQDKQADIDLQKEIDEANFKEAAKLNSNILSPDNPLIGKIDHTGGGITRDPGSKVEGAPTHSTRDDLMATGGRVGFKYGGLASIL